MAIEVQTTQNVTIDYEPAGIGNRLVAYAIDWFIVILWFAGWYAIDILSHHKLFDTYGSYAGQLLVYIIIIIPFTFYHLLWECFNNGQSPGKKVMKIRVVNIDGSVPSTGSYLLRWLFRLVDIFASEGILGIIMIVATDKSQRLGDMLAGTTVITLKVNAKNKQLRALDLDFHEDYKVTYADVLSRLSDKDIQTIISITDNDTNAKKSEYFIEQLALRIKSITGYNYNGPDIAFLKKIVSDYNYLALQ